MECCVIVSKKSSKNVIDLFSNCFQDPVKFLVDIVSLPGDL